MQMPSATADAPTDTVAPQLVDAAAFDATVDFSGGAPITAESLADVEGEEHAERVSSQVVLENLDSASSLPQEAFEAVKNRMQALKQSAGQWGGKMIALLDKKQDAASLSAPAAPASPPPPTASADAAVASDGKASELGTTTGKFIAAAAERMTDFGRASKQNAAWVMQTAAESIKRMATPSHTLRAVCRQDASSRPVPQSVLLLCSAVARSPAGAAALFQGDHDAEAATLLHRLEEGKMLLLPPDVSPAVASAALKQLLQSLSEPLLLARLADQWIAAADDAAAAHALLQQLPAANLTTLRAVLLACRYVTTTAAPPPCPPGDDCAAPVRPASTTPAAELAATLAPVLLWRVAGRRPALDVPAALASVRSKISNVMVSVTAPSVATHDLGVVEERGPGAEAGFGVDEVTLAPVKEEEAAAAPSGVGDLASATAATGAATPATAGGLGEATAVHVPEEVALPPSVAIVSPSVGGQSSSRKSASLAAPTSPGGRSGVAPSESELAEDDGLLEEEAGGQHVALTGDEAAAVASVLQMLIQETPLP